MSKSSTIAYATWAIGNIIKIAKDYTVKSVDWVANRQRYNVEITLEGVIMDSRIGLTAPQIISLLDTMSNFGNLQIHITNSGEPDDKRDVHSGSPEGSDKGHQADKTVHTDSEFSI